MYSKETGGSSNHNLGVPKKGMEKTTPSSNQPARDRAKLSDKSTPENLGSSRGMRPSDGSGSQYEKQMLNLMQTIMHKEQDTGDQLKQANQKILELTQERDNLKSTLSNKLKEALWEKEQLAKQLEQANRKIEELANQLEQASSSETSSLQTEEANSPSISSNKSDEERIRNWFASKTKPWEMDKGKSKYKKK